MIAAKRGVAESRPRRGGGIDINGSIQKYALNLINILHIYHKREILGYICFGSAKFAITVSGYIIKMIFSVYQPSVSTTSSL